MDALARIISRIKLFIKDLDDNQTLELLEHISSGKMLRSKLILKIAGISDEAIKLCAIVEMIHLASLLHDDVIDNSNTRRGKPSLNSIYDNKTAIMFGDILYSTAFCQLSTMNSKISYSISKSVSLLSLGELLDVRLSNEFNESYDKYMDMIYKKTASLIEASAYSASILSGLDTNIYSLYGKNLGLAFQLIDDILDITQSTKTLGKPCMSDFYEGKMTIPYLILYDRIDDKLKFKSLYKKRLSINEINWIKDNMHKTSSLKDSINIAKNLGKEAIGSIKDEKNSIELINIMKDMINRDF